MRTIRAVHDVALALLAGGIAGVGMAVTVLFAKAPSREVAGQIGSATFARLGPVVLLLAMVVFGARLVTGAGATGSAGLRRLGLSLSGVALALAAVNAVWLTPRMVGLWNEGPHAADGTGLAEPARHRFLALHGMSNLAYLAILLLCLALLILPPGPAGDRPTASR